MKQGTQQSPWTVENNLMIHYQLEIWLIINYIEKLDNTGVTMMDNEPTTKKPTIYPIKGSSPTKPVKWSELTPTERRLYIIVGLLFLVVIALTATLAVFGIPLVNRDDICTNEKCVKVAGGILAAMDESVDPCQDFYQFACGSWIKNNPVPESKGSWDQFDVLTTQLSRKVREILERENNNDDLRPVAIAKEMYEICLEQENYEGIDDLRNMIADYVDTDTDFSHLGKTMGRIRRETISDGNALLFAIYVDLEQVENTYNVIYVDSPSLSLAQPYLLDQNSTKFRDAYHELISTIWPMIYPEEGQSNFSTTTTTTTASSTNASTIADEILNFSTQLAEIITKQEDRRNWTKLYNPVKLEQLINMTSEASMIDWVQTLQEVFKDIPTFVNNVTNWRNLTIIVRDAVFFKNFGKLISATDPDLIKKFLRWCLIFEYGEEASSKLREVFFQYNQKTKGLKYPEPRWKKCSDWIKSDLGLAVSYDYVRENFDDKSKEKVEKMLGDVRRAFYEILNELDWIEEPTRLIAKEKASKIRPFIAYPDFLKNNITHFEEYYKLLTMPSPPTHLRNQLQLAKWTNIKKLSEITKTRDVARWRSYATVVNAYFYSSYNSVIFPAGILQIPFYGFPIEALNYGSIGWVMGHEISHGFDDEGRQTDQDGKLVNWWDPVTLENFSNKAKCFIEQYGNFYASEVNLTLNGINTQGENIADNGGMQQAYRAYQYYKGRHGVEKGLPGLNYSPDQLFFIAFAQAWCGTSTKESLYSQVMTGAHAPNRFRVTGTLQNSEDFADTFNCPRPKNKKTCRIW